jgi:hypothetical protein
VPLPIANWSELVPPPPPDDGFTLFAADPGLFPSNPETLGVVAGIQHAAPFVAQPGAFTLNVKVQFVHVGETLLYTTPGLQAGHPG